jgi:hypothetical protein
MMLKRLVGKKPLRLGGSKHNAAVRKTLKLSPRITRSEAVIK